MNISISFRIAVLLKIHLRKSAQTIQSCGVWRGVVGCDGVLWSVVRCGGVGWGGNDERSSICLAMVK